MNSKSRRIFSILPIVLIALMFSFSANGQTVTKDFVAGGSITVDGVGDFGTALTGITFLATDFTDCCDVTDVNVSITWAKNDGTCAAPVAGTAEHAQTSFLLESPTGAQVILVPSGTYTGQGSMNLTTTEFDQTAGSVVGGLIPTAGSFQPTGNLDDFNGTDGIGTWILRAGDNGATDPLCIASYEIELTLTTTVLTIPTLGEWGLIAFSLLLLNMAALFLVKRRKRKRLLEASVS